MDAVTFLREHKRMCAARPCVACPVCATGQGCIEDDNPELVVATVEEWSASHPRKTRQSVFLEQYPEANISEHGVLLVCPCPISASHRNAHGGCATIGRRCDDCRKEYWMQEVE